MTPLRDYQARTIEAARAEFRGGKRAVCITLPTGAGKTCVGAAIVRNHIAKGGRGLWLAHRAELVAQAADRLRGEGLDQVGVIAAGVEGNSAAPVQVASIQTLVARDARPDATLVVFDECHHYAAAEWGAVARFYEGAHRIGLTATPERSDGKPLGDLFDALVAPVEVKELTEGGYLVPCEVRAPKRRLPRQMAGDPVDRYLAMARGRRAIFFAALVEQADELATRLCGAGVPAMCIHADTPAGVRADAIARLGTGDLLALTNVFVLTEGTDIPPAEVCVLARGFSHASTYLQCVGRVLRPSPSTGKTEGTDIPPAEVCVLARGFSHASTYLQCVGRVLRPSPSTGKSSALVLDLCGVSRRFGVPGDTREYSLDGRAITVVGKVDDADEAPAGTPITAPQVVAAELAIVTEIAATAAKWTRGRTGEHRVALERLLRTARNRGFKQGWAVHRFKERFGFLPWPGA